MKLHVIYDRQGKVLAAGLPRQPAMEMGGPDFGPDPQEEQHAAELEVPEELTGTKFHQLGERLMVDTRSKPHRLMPRSK